MNTKPTRDEDGGYGSGNLVGSSTSGLRSAIEAQHALDSARTHETKERDDARRANADLGRLADDRLLDLGGTAPGDTAGASTLGDRTGGTRASAGRSDANRNSRDDGNSLRE